jgi:hypothetical protein
MEKASVPAGSAAELKGLRGLKRTHKIKQSRNGRRTDLKDCAIGSEKESLSYPYYCRLTKLHTQSHRFFQAHSGNPESWLRPFAFG